MTRRGSAEVIHLHPDQGAQTWARERESWMRHLEREGKSPATIDSYTASLNAWERSIVARGRSLDPFDLEREDAEAFLDDLRGANRVPSTQRQRASIARLWCDWLIDQGVREEPNPWTKVANPRNGRLPVIELVDASVIVALREATKGRDFLAARDRAIVLFLLDAGVRRAEAAGLLMEDLIPGTNTALVVGKGDKRRQVKWGDDTARALDVYLRARKRHPDAARVQTVGRADRLRKGRPLFLLRDDRQRGSSSMHPDAVNAMLQRRMRSQGLDPKGVRPHRLRHTWAHLQKVGGTSTEELMILGGWDNPASAMRYARSAATERALAHYRSPVDDLLAEEHRARRSKR